MLTSSRTPSGPRRVTTSPSTAKSFAARCCGDWWPQEVSEKLQQFYDDLVNGQRPKVAIMAPPQHGKSTAATDFITWVAGQDPNLKTIFASFSDTLGEGLYQPRMARGDDATHGCSDLLIIYHA